MNLKKLMKWSLVLMVFLAYKQLEASVVQGEDTRPEYSVVTPAAPQLWKSFSVHKRQL